MPLQEQIDSKKKQIHAEGYPMSIGELMSLYERHELDIHPEFQRFFRWSPLQKTKLIESLLLGIPIPSIFVSQREDGVWDVIDGVQRLSTIFQFVGLLRNEDGTKIPPEPLQETEYLPALKGKYWASDSEHSSFANALRLAFKREKLDLKIIKKESDPNAKYELFQRLNTLGTSLSRQEVRNCLLIMVDRKFYDWLQRLTDFKPFQTCISISENQTDQRYDMELTLRYLLFKRAKDEDLRNMDDVHAFLTEHMRGLVGDPTFDRKEEDETFRAVFSLLGNALGDESFRRYDKAQRKFVGPFLVSAFEVIAVGIGHNISSWRQGGRGTQEELKGRIRGIWRNSTFLRYSGAGVRGTTRAAALVPLGRKWFRL